MFEPKARQIAYRIRKPDGSVVEINVHLNAEGLLEKLPDAGPEWTRCQGTDCGDCQALAPHCRAALAIAPLIDKFADLTSLDVITAEVEMNDRRCVIEGPAARTLASLMGLLMAASGCSHLAVFRTMAQFHQPFATAEETVVRAAGFWLLQRWSTGNHGQEDPFAPLIDAWTRLEDVNARIGRQLMRHCATDAAPNGLALLDALAKIGIHGLDKALEALRPTLRAGAPAQATP